MKSLQCTEYTKQCTVNSVLNEMKLFKCIAEEEEEKKSFLCTLYTEKCTV